MSDRERDVLSLPEGDAVFQCPAKLSTKSKGWLMRWVELLLEKIEVAEDAPQRKPDEKPALPVTSGTVQTAHDLLVARCAKGGRAAAAKMTPEERKERAKKAVEARWRKAGKRDKRETT